GVAPGGEGERESGLGRLPQLDRHLSVPGGPRRRRSARRVQLRRAEPQQHGPPHAIARVSDPHRESAADRGSRPRSSLRLDNQLRTADRRDRRGELQEGRASGARARSRSSYFLTFPVEVFGSSPNSTSLGALNPGSVSRAKEISSGSVNVEPFRSE